MTNGHSIHAGGTTAFNQDLFDGALGFLDAQVAFKGPVDLSFKPKFVNATWYDTSVDPNRGAFAVVQFDDPDWEPVIGKAVRVSYGRREVLVYVIKGVPLPADNPFALYRRAWLQLTDLWDDGLRVHVQLVARLEENHE